MKKLKHIIYALAVMSAVSCVYDFDPEIKGESRYLVVEGDILVGDVSRFTLSYSRGLADDPSPDVSVPATVTVEGDDGSSVSAVSGGNFVIDTRNLDPAARYRLTVRLIESGKEICSPWLEVRRAGRIDSISYVIDPLTRETMWVTVTASGENGENYYQWKCDETWEYCADYYAHYYYEPGYWTVVSGKPVYVDGKVVEFKEGENNYYCWRTGRVPDVMLGDASSLSSPVFSGHKLYSILNRDQKISYIYSPEVVQTALSPEAFRYWTAISRNSDDVGGLFSPQPSECRGNLRCVQDESEMVLGYVNASTVSRKRIFITEGRNFWKRDDFTEAEIEPVFLVRSQWQDYYNDHYLPFRLHPVDKEGEEDPAVMEWYDWYPGHCVDCRRSGGGKYKPSWWPNDHN